MVSISYLVLKFNDGTGFRFCITFYASHYLTSRTICISWSVLDPWKSMCFTTPSTICAPYWFVHASVFNHLWMLSMKRYFTFRDSKRSRELYIVESLGISYMTSWVDQDHLWLFFTFSLSLRTLLVAICHFVKNMSSSAAQLQLREFRIAFKVSACAKPRSHVDEVMWVLTYVCKWLLQWLRRK